MTRFELATPRPPDVYATRLRYIPNDAFNLYFQFSTTGNFFSETSSSAVYTEPAEVLHPEFQILNSKNGTAKITKL